MRRYLMLALLPWSAFGLTLSPMLLDDVVLHSHYVAKFSVHNGNDNYQEFKYWIDYVEDEKQIKSGEFGVAGKTTHQLNISIIDIIPDKKEVYRVCVQEKPLAGVQVALRNCARLRLYWPHSVLTDQ